MGEFQSLGAVDGHHVHRLALLVDLIRIRRQGHFFEKTFERLTEGHIAEFLSDREQLPHVLLARLSLRRVIGQALEIPAFFRDTIQELRE